MLGVAGAHGDGARVAVPNININIRQRGIKSAGTGVRDRRFGGFSGALTAAAETGATAREEEHHFFLSRILKARGVGGKDDNRPRGAVADHADAGPNVKRIGDAIAAGREKNDSLAS